MIDCDWVDIIRALLFQHFEFNVYILLVFRFNKINIKLGAVYLINI